MKPLFRFLSAVGLTAALSSTTFAKETSPTWAQDVSDIKSDATVKYGKLPNGMKYILMPNKEPANRVSMRLHIAAGSLMEREDQRGVAHFLEHMVFNGSKHFPDSKLLIPKMQRLGIGFGAHLNAYTSFDETVYKLDLPNKNEDTLKLGFDVMRDFGDGAFLKLEEINKERGIILSEKTSRDSVQSRLMQKQFNALLPNAILGKRFPIGTEKIIKTAPRSAFTDFYNQYYTPSRITFIYVGDFDVKEAEKRIIENFSSMKATVTPGKSPNLGTVPSGVGFKTLVMGDPEVGSTDITLLKTTSFTRKPDTKASRAQKLPINLANAMLNRRFSILAKQENSTISGGSTFQENLFNFIKLGAISVDAKNHNWRAAIPVLEQEFRRAMLYGFTQSEFNEAKANLINAYEQQVKAKPSRKSSSLASSLAMHVHKNAVFSSPEEDLRILQENLKSLTAESCHKAFKKSWATKDLTLILTTNTKPKNEGIELEKIYQKSKLIRVSPPKIKNDIQFAYTKFGKEGAIKSKKHIKDLDISQIHFHNGCSCNVKKTDFTKNSISITARIGAGKLTMPKDKLGLDVFSSSVFTAGGLGKHSTDELRSILAGKNANIGFSVSDNAFVFSGSTTPEDLELELQLLCAYLTDPGFRPEAERLFKAQIPAIYSQLKHTQAGANNQIDAFLHGNDYRFIFPTQKQAEALSMDDVKSWLTPALRNGALEISIVGDFDEEKLTSILKRTIGALPKRKETQKNKPLYLTQRALKNLPTPPSTKHYTFESRIPTGAAMVVWKGPGLHSKNIGITRRMSILSSILSDRMREKIREELGEAYSPYSGFKPESTYKDLGYLMAVSSGKPEQSKRVGKLILKIGEQLAKEGATEDELQRALAPQLSMLKKSLRDNTYWLYTVMSQSQEQPYHLDWARQRDKDYNSITLKEINSLAKKYLSEKNAFRFELIPEKK